MVQENWLNPIIQDRPYMHHVVHAIKHTLDQCVSHLLKDTIGPIYFSFPVNLFCKEIVVRKIRWLDHLLKKQDARGRRFSRLP